jgi:uncharacterized protein (TIGR03032 family)
MSTETQPTVQHRDIFCSHSESLPQILTDLRLSLLISTYQTGHLVVVTARQGKLVLTFHQFERAMGVAVKPGTISVCTRKEVWFLRNSPDIAQKLNPRGQFDACFMARATHFTGDIQTHETAWSGNDFWLVNTSFSCLAVLHPIYSFAPRWRPPFITALAPEDRCHLNGLAMVDGQPRYVTAFAQTDTKEGWREVKSKSGCLMEVPSGRVVVGGLALPHSPRVHGNKLYFLESGNGFLKTVNATTGQVDPVAEVPGVCRGMAMINNLAFIGLSRARPSLEGVPIVAERDKLKCGLVVVDLQAGKIVAQLIFHKGVDELFDIQLLPGLISPHISGPSADQDTGHPLWTVPPS